MYELDLGSVEDIEAMPANLSILFNTGQGIGTETCVLDILIPLLLKAVDLRYDI